MPPHTRLAQVIFHMDRDWKSSTPLKEIMSSLMQVKTTLLSDHLCVCVWLLLISPKACLRVQAWFKGRAQNWVQLRVRVRGLLMVVIIIHSDHESPHKDRSTVKVVCV